MTHLIQCEYKIRASPEIHAIRSSGLAKSGYLLGYMQMSTNTHLDHQNKGIVRFHNRVTQIPNIIPKKCNPITQLFIFWIVRLFSLAKLL